MPSGVAYNHETIQLDGETYIDCEFRDARLVYSGGVAPKFERCRFDGCEWKFEDAAARTLAHMKTLWAVGAKAVVQAEIKDITGSAR
jgi:hypothetical protein